MFTGGNVVYALLGTLPRTEYKLRVWLMLVARFLVGSGTGQSRTQDMPVVADLSEKVERKVCFIVTKPLKIWISAAALPCCCFRKRPRKPVLQRKQ